MLDTTDLLGLTGTTDVGRLALRTTGGDNRQPARQQVVTSVTVPDLNGVTGSAEVLDLGRQNQLHQMSLRSYRVAELNGSRATSRAFFTAIAMSRWC